MPRTTHPRDLTGSRYGKLTVITFSHFVGGASAYWRCICDCGRETTVHRGNLVTGHTKTCGCGMMAARKAKKIECAKRKKHPSAYSKLVLQTRGDVPCGLSSAARVVAPGG